MSRYERTKYFERLVELHVIYAMRGDVDRTAIMTLEEAIAWVEAEMAAAPTPDRRGDQPD